MVKLPLRPPISVCISETANLPYPIWIPSWGGGSDFSEIKNLTKSAAATKSYSTSGLKQHTYYNVYTITLNNAKYIQIEHVMNYDSCIYFTMDDYPVFTANNTYLDDKTMYIPIINCKGFANIKLYVMLDAAGGSSHTDTYYLYN